MAKNKDIQYTTIKASGDLPGKHFVKVNANSAHGNIQLLMTQNGKPHYTDSLGNLHRLYHPRLTKSDKEQYPSVFGKGATPSKQSKLLFTRKLIRAHYRAMCKRFEGWLKSGRVPYERGTPAEVYFGIALITKGKLKPVELIMTPKGAIMGKKRYYANLANYRKQLFKNGGKLFQLNAKYCKDPKQKCAEKFNLQAQQTNMKRPEIRKEHWHADPRTDELISESMLAYSDLRKATAAIRAAEKKPAAKKRVAKKTTATKQVAKKKRTRATKSHTKKSAHAAPAAQIVNNVIAAGGDVHEAAEKALSQHVSPKQVATALVNEVKISLPQAQAVVAQEVTKQKLSIEKYKNLKKAIYDRIPEDNQQQLLEKAHEIRAKGGLKNNGQYKMGTKEALMKAKKSLNILYK